MVQFVAAFVLQSQVELNDQTFETWRQYIVPKASELAFESCGWHGTLWSAVLEANRQDKPILLWAMNGHPLACT